MTDFFNVRKNHWVFVFSHWNWYNICKHYIKIPLKFLAQSLLHITSRISNNDKKILKLPYVPVNFGIASLMI
jgi:hypothetical protein